MIVSFDCNNGCHAVAPFNFLTLVKFPFFQSFVRIPLRRLPHNQLQSTEERETKNPLFSILQNDKLCQIMAGISRILNKIQLNFDGNSPYRVNT